MSHTYLLLDGARFEHLPTLLLTLDSTLTPYPLYANTAYSLVSDLGPWLVRVEPDGQVAKTFRRDWQGKHGLWLESDAPHHLLLGHLSSLVHLQLAGTETVLFRFYDPSVTARWLRPLSYPERDRLMGPVQLMRWSQGNGDTHEVRRQSAVLAARYAHTPWLRFSIEQFERLNQSQLETFDRKLIDHVRQFAPTALQQMDEAKQLAWAACCRQNAARYGLTSEADVLGWAGLSAEYGDCFPERPEHAVYRALLSEPGLTPSQRLERAQVEQIRQLVLSAEVSS
ncbi:DUF4123 domain-containing protein [Pseudomonas sp. SDI]|uniref:DUF4123 domain-containing protein n=1 Tax=Pseudomonas sp. SDI TaxID=2170734 RepID=UPI000DE74C74|nr:DUF4123 domain-containing protein [Pseudomonas sp. SDI]PWB30616.1 DUF4123 domain-containing protein [Pseudomonas sp. SDI]